jgi:hypothetical protein
MQMAPSLDIVGLFLRIAGDEGRKAEASAGLSLAAETKF